MMSDKDVADAFKDARIEELQDYAERSSNRVYAAGQRLYDGKSSESIKLDEDTAFFLGIAREIALELIRRLREKEQSDDTI